MGRKKIQMKRITDSSDRSVTFRRRKVALLKKLIELSAMCNTEVAAIVFDERNEQPTVYSSSPGGITSSLERLMRFSGPKELTTNDDYERISATNEAKKAISRKNENYINSPLEKDVCSMEVLKNFFTDENLNQNIALINKNIQYFDRKRSLDHAFLEDVKKKRKTEDLKFEFSTSINDKNPEYFLSQMNQLLCPLSEITQNDFSIEKDDKAKKKIKSDEVPETRTPKNKNIELRNFRGTLDPLYLKQQEQTFPKTFDTKDSNSELVPHLNQSTHINSNFPTFLMPLIPSETVQGIREMKGFGSPAVPLLQENDNPHDFGLLADLIDSEEKADIHDRYSQDHKKLMQLVNSKNLNKLTSPADFLGAHIRQSIGTSSESFSNANGERPENDGSCGAKDTSHFIEKFFI